MKDWFTAVELQVRSFFTMSEHNNITDESLAEFREGYSTVDNISFFKRLFKNIYRKNGADFIEYP